MLVLNLMIRHIKQLFIHLFNGRGIYMKEYKKPYIEDEDVEIEDIISASKELGNEDEEDPFF